MVHIGLVLLVTNLLGYPHPATESSSSHEKPGLVFGWISYIFSTFISLNFVFLVFATAGIATVFLWNAKCRFAIIAQFKISWHLAEFTLDVFLYAGKRYQPTSKWDTFVYLLNLKAIASSALLGFFCTIAFRAYINLANWELGKIIYSCQSDKYEMKIYFYVYFSCMDSLFKNFFLSFFRRLSNHYGYCMNEKKFFLLSNMFVMGALFNCIHVAEHRYVINFPALYRPNMERLRLFLMNYTTKSFWKILRLLPLCYSAYMVFGNLTVIFI